MIEHVYLLSMAYAMYIVYMYLYVTDCRLHDQQHEHICISVWLADHFPTGHMKAREAMTKHTVRETPLSFRKKRAPTTSDENRQALKLTPTITSRTPAAKRTSSSGGSRGLKRKATGIATTPHRVLQLHNYFTKTDDE